MSFFPLRAFSHFCELTLTFPFGDLPYKTPRDKIAHSFHLNSFYVFRP